MAKSPHECGKRIVSSTVRGFNIQVEAIFEEHAQHAALREIFAGKN